MNAKKRGLGVGILFSVLLVLVSVGAVSETYAESASTEVTVQFAPEEGKDKKDDRVIPVSVNKDSNGTGYQAKDYSTKRLPSTNDQYQLILSQLGYLALLLFLILLIVRKREERAP